MTTKTFGEYIAMVNKSKVNRRKKISLRRAEKALKQARQQA